VFENRMWRRIFGWKVKDGWRKIHNEEVHNLYSSSSIMMVTKSRRMMWEGHVACMGDMKNAYKIREDTTWET
jgi:hypothetical protein